VGDLADQRVGHGHQHDVGVLERRRLVDAVGADRVLQALLADVAHLDMGDVVGRALEVGREPHPHLAARTQQCRPWSSLSLPIMWPTALDQPEEVQRPHLAALQGDLEPVQSRIAARGPADRAGRGQLDLRLERGDAEPVERLARGVAAGDGDAADAGCGDQRLEDGAEPVADPCVDVSASAPAAAMASLRPWMVGSSGPLAVKTSGHMPAFSTMRASSIAASSA
jgi:hypothetical protein